MTIKLTLPTAAPQTAAYTEAKAEGELLTIDALQKKYSPNYEPDSLHANWPHNMEAALANIPDDAAALKRARGIIGSSGRPEFLEAVLDRFPAIAIKDNFKDIVLQFGSPFVEVFIRRRLADTTEYTPVLKYQADAKKWAALKIHTPSACYGAGAPPEGLNLETVVFAQHALYAERIFPIQHLYIFAGLFFETPLDLMRYYAAAAHSHTSLSLHEALERLVVDFFNACPERTRKATHFGQVMSTPVAELRAYGLKARMNAPQPSARTWLPKVVP